MFFVAGLSLLLASLSSLGEKQPKWRSFSSAAVGACAVRVLLFFLVRFQLPICVGACRWPGLEQIPHTWIAYDDDGLAPDQ